MRVPFVSFYPLGPPYNFPVALKRVAVTYNLERKLGPYELAVRQAGLEPVALAGPSDVLAGDFDGLVLTGGSDIGGDAPDRDALELRLAGEALARDLPVLGICRGLQVLNVALGGTLFQDIPGHRAGSGALEHEVRIVSGSRLERIVGQTVYRVNSRHHQAVDRLGAGLEVTASAPDGIVEGLELPGCRFVVAVQWLPEDRVLSHGGDQRLFAAFAEAVMIHI
jgi:putative glutamine amidotransferase